MYNYCLTILTSGVYDLETYSNAVVEGSKVVTGVELTSSAFHSVIPFGGRLYLFPS